MTSPGFNRLCHAGAGCNYDNQNLDQQSRPSLVSRRRYKYSPNPTYCQEVIIETFPPRNPP